MVQIINLLKQFSRSAQESMSRKTKASILWIILLQSRQFAMGEIAILAEFSAMHTNLAAKHSLIIHAEVPSELIEDKLPTPKAIDDKTKDQGLVKRGDQKRQKTGGAPNKNTWHPKLKGKLEKAMASGGNPSFSSILRYCKKTAEEVYPLIGRKCAPNTLFGKCYLGDKCARDHSLSSDKEVTNILTLVEPFITNPEEIKQGQ